MSVKRSVVAGFTVGYVAVAAFDYSGTECVAFIVISVFLTIVAFLVCAGCDSTVFS